MATKPPDVHLEDLARGVGISTRTPREDRESSRESNLKPWQFLADGLRETLDTVSRQPVLDGESIPVQDLFTEVPPDFDDFVKEDAYLGQPPLTPKQLQAFTESTIGLSPYNLLDENRIVNTIVLEWGKGSQLRTSLVWLPAEGRYCQLGDLKSTIVAGINENNQVGTYLCDDSHLEGIGECFRVGLAVGVHAEVFSEHRYLTPTGWRMLRDLHVGDKVASVIKLPVTNPVAIDPREVELIGFMLGDGHMTGKGSYQSYFMSSIHDVNARNRFEDILRSYDLTPVTKPCLPLKRNAFKTSGAIKPGHHSVTNGKRTNPFNDIIRKCHLDNTGPHTKFVPEPFFNLPDEQVALFLGALWGTDGHIYLGGSTPEIAYTTVSEILAQGVQTMLLRLGIRSQITTKNVKYSASVNPLGVEERRVAYVVRIRDMSMAVRFCELVKLYDKFNLQAAVLDWAARSKQHQSDKLDGDVYFTRITSIESIGEQEYWDHEVEQCSNFVTVGGVVNHNSGKDMVSAHFISWVTFVLLCLADLGKTLRMPPGENIDVVNVAPSGRQSREIFFSKLRQRLDRPCFQKFKPKMSTIDATFITAHNEIRVHSEHSESETFEGYNIFAWVMDGASAFRSKTFARNSDKVYNTLRTSATTRFKQRWVGMIISFPRQADDFIEKMVKLAKTQRSLYAMGPLATWDVLPWLTREDFKDDFAIDPEAAATMLMCLPPAQFNKFFNDRQTLDAARCRLTSSFLTMEPYISSHELSDGHTKEFVAWDVKLVNEDIIGGFYIHGDPGLTVDSFQVAIGTTVLRDIHTVKTPSVIEAIAGLASQPIDFKEEIPVQVALIQWMPQAGKQVDFLNVADVIEYLCANLNVLHVTFDQWNSAFLIQRMLSKGILATDISFSNKMQFAIYRNFRSLVNSGRCEITNEEILLQELKELERRNHRIDHPSDGSKDAADAVGTVLWFASGAAELMLPDGGGETVISDGGVFAGHRAAAPPGVSNTVRKSYAGSPLGPNSSGYR